MQAGSTNNAGVDALSTANRWRAKRGDKGKVSQIAGYFALDIDGRPAKGNEKLLKMKLLYAKIIGEAAKDLVDNHPEVAAMAKLNAAQLTQKLWKSCGRIVIDSIHAELFPNGCTDPSILEK